MTTVQSEPCAAAAKGNLYLVPNTLGDGDEMALRSVLPDPVRAIAARLDYYVGENAKQTRAFLKRIGMQQPIQAIRIAELNVHTPEADIAALLEPIANGRDGGLVSDAGCPAVADPGALLVRRAHAQGIRVVPLVGPSSILLAVMASGLDGQRFAFHGYLPTETDARAQRIRALERHSREWDQTQIFIETPYRNDAMFDALLAHCGPQTLICIASDLTLPSEQVMTRTAAAWKREPARLLLAKRPAIFLILAR